MNPLALLKALPLVAQLALGAGAAGTVVGGLAWLHHSVYQDGYSAAAAQCDASRLAASIVVLQADLAAAEQAASSAAALASAADDRASTLEERLSSYDDETSEPPVCALDDADVSRLRALTR